MPETLEIVSATGQIQANPRLPASKSLSNRLLVLQAVSGNAFPIEGISDAEDTRLLAKILQNKPHNAHAGEGGTTFRFALAYLASCEGYEGILTGSERLCQRPQHTLIDALRSLGAEIECLRQEGHAPVRIRGKKLVANTIQLDTSVSSQFITALLLIAPQLEGELRLELHGDRVSPSYLSMTLQLMDRVGVHVTQLNHVLTVSQPGWNSQIQHVERDWSAASYWYAMLALAKRGSVFLEGLSRNSLQGDRQIADIFALMGIRTTEDSRGITLQKIPVAAASLDLNCLDIPDMAQTLVVVCAALGIHARFSGLSTLVHKETDRISAMVTELQKLKIQLQREGNEAIRILPSTPDFSKTLIVETYNDHRMAMAFAPLVMRVYKMAIRNPEVVSKSYPGFWRDIREAGISFAEWEG